MRKLPIIIIMFLLLSAICLNAADGYWQKILGDTTGSPQQSFNTIAIDYWQNIFIGTKQSEIYRSRDHGGTWQLIHKYSDKHPNIKYSVSSIVAMPSGHLIACQWNDGIYFSDDHGDHWTMRGLEDYSIGKAAAHPDGRIYVASSGPNNLYTSHDEGNNWKIVPAKNPDFHKTYPIHSIALGADYRIFLIVDGIVAVSANEAPYGFLIDRSFRGESVFVAGDQTLFIGTYEGMMYYSIDRGVHFTAVQIPGQTSEIICFGEDRKGYIYLGTNGNGIWHSQDRGNTWMKEAIENTIVNQLVADSAGAMYAAAQSGVYKRVDNPLMVSQRVVIPDQTVMLFPAYPNPFNSSIAIEFRSLAGDVTVQIIDINGRHVATICDQKLSKGFQHFFWHGKDSRGCQSCTGIYFISIRTVTDGMQATALQKVILLR